MEEERIFPLKRSPKGKGGIANKPTPKKHSVIYRNLSHRMEKGDLKSKVTPIERLALYHASRIADGRSVEDEFFHNEYASNEIKDMFDPTKVVDHERAKNSKIILQNLLERIETGDLRFRFTSADKEAIQYFVKEFEKKKC